MSKSKDKYAGVLWALEKIAKNTGEDEYHLIVELEQAFNIVVTKDEAFSLRNKREIWIWVKEKYNSVRFNKEKKRLASLDPTIQVEKYVKRFGKEDLFAYPERVKDWRINQEIFEILKEKYEIVSNDLTGIEWSKLLKRKEWNDAYLQVARKEVAKNMSKRTLEGYEKHYKK